MDAFLNVFREALGAIREPRLFTTELGFQGELLAEIRQRLPTLGLPGDPIIQQEYQKTIPLHELTIRPDLIVHVPFERNSVASRRDGNFVAVEMKVAATEAQARQDFESLEAMKEMLGYPLTIFLNINSTKTFASACPPSIAQQTVCFAVRLRDGVPEVSMERPLGKAGVP